MAIWKHGSGAREYGFQKRYLGKGLTTEEHADRVEKRMRKEITRKV